jgi:hypothetical protein
MERKQKSKEQSGIESDLGLWSLTPHPDSEPTNVYSYYLMVHAKWKISKCKF